MKVEVLIYKKQGEDMKVRRTKGEVKGLISYKKYKKMIDDAIKNYASPYMKLREINDKVFHKDYVLNFENKFVSVNGAFITSYGEEKWTIALKEEKNYKKVKKK